jgi:hypothetical protein
MVSVFLRQNVEQGQSQKQVSVEALDVAEQHRYRISLEKQSEGILLGFQAAPAVELKPGTATGIENSDERRKRFACGKSSAYFRETAPTELLHGSLHEAGPRHH